MNSNQNVEEGPPRVGSLWKSTALNHEDEYFIITKSRWATSAEKHDHDLAHFQWVVWVEAIIIFDGVGADIEESFMPWVDFLNWYQVMIP